MQIETVEIPFIVIDGRKCLTVLDIDDKPWVREFYERFKHCFEYEILNDVMILKPEAEYLS